MAYSSEQPRDEHGRWASFGAPSEACAERIRLGQENTPSEGQVRLAMQAPARQSGIHDATLGKTLAEVSAEGTNPGIPPPKEGQSRATKHIPE
jgi:hypothetical protein